MKLKWEFKLEGNLPAKGKSERGKANAALHGTTWKVFVTSLTGRVFMRESTSELVVKADIKDLTHMCKWGWKEEVGNYFRANYKEVRIGRNGELVLNDITDLGFVMFPKKVTE